jgi:site-specific recombinase
MAVFAALAIAWPLALRWSLAAWIAGGLAVLQAPAAAAVLVFAQRTGVVVASPGARAAVETVYRVLLAPSIQYALPAALWLFIHSLSEGWSWARDLLRARGH